MFFRVNTVFSSVSVSLNGRLNNQNQSIEKWNDTAEHNDKIKNVLSANRKTLYDSAVTDKFFYFLVFNG